MADLTTAKSELRAFLASRLSSEDLKEGSRLIAALVGAAVRQKITERELVDRVHSFQWKLRDLGIPV